MKEKVLKTFIIICMIASITIAHVMVLASDVVSYAFQDVGKENVEFSSYFVTEQGEQLPSIEKEINSEDIRLSMRIKVKQQGYLNGKIELKNENFKFKQEPIEGVEEIKEREITLKQINSHETLEFQIGLEISVPNSVDVNQFNKDNLVVLKGTCTTANQSQKEIEMEQNIPVILTSPYQEGEEANYLEAQIITNKVYKIGEQNKRIVQMQIQNGLQGDGYPIKQTELEIEAPEGVEDVKVLQRGLLATNGGDELQTQKEENKLQIQITNPIKDEKINYGKQKNDTLILTYVYEEDKDLAQTEIKVKSKVQIYDQQGTTFEAEKIAQIDQEKEEIIAYHIVNQSELYKGKIYASEEENYRSLSKIDIRYPRNRRQYKSNRRKCLL